MADPISFATGLGAGLITEHLAGVVRKLYTELQHIQKCHNECESFKHQLDSLSGFLKEIEPAIVLQLPNSDFVKAWWSDLKKCLDESLYLVSSFRPDTKCNLRNFFFKNSLRKGILAKRDELERLLRDAKINKGLLIINVNETKQLASDVSKVKGDVEKMNQILSEIGESTKMYLQSEGDKQAIASKLSTFKSFSRNEEISKHVVHESFFLQQEEEPLFGREKLIKELEVQLLNPQGPKVIAFHGMGGAGKTRLVKALINRPKVQSYFGKAQNLFWVSVGRDSKMLDLQAKVEKHISSISEDKPREDKPENQIRRLIVLDDLWKKEEIRFAQRKSESSEFRFLITTRQQKMVDEYNNIYPVLVPILSETDSWNLFIYHAFSFRSADYILYLDDVAKQVAQRCKGLPLALKVIGRAMSDKMTVREWNEALCSLKNHITIDNDHDMDLMQVLRISYDALESIEEYVGQVRKCFLYFGAFKEDAYIDVQSLMNCWVGEGLLKAHRNPVSQTYIVLGVLIGSSLVEKVPDDRCQIHDMLRELTFYITKQERPHENLFQATNNQQLNKLDYARILRISWFDAKLFAAVKIQAPKLKVILLDGSSVSEVFLNSCFANLCSLEVLSLKETNIEYLPESLGKLQRLVVLSLCQSHIRSLPYSLRMLRQLKILDLSDCSYLQELPKDAFLDLKNLQVFKLRCSWKTSPVLRPCFLHKERIGKERTFAKHFSDEDAAEFRYLTGLTLFDFCGTTTELPAFMENMSQLTVLHISCPIRDLEPLKALNTLEDLKVLHSDLTELPDWISELSFLIKLRISTTNRMATYLPDMHALCRLRRLKIEGWESLVSFPKLPHCLEELYISFCNSLERLSNVEGECFTSLRTLELTFCQKLSLKNCGHFTKLQHLYVSFCDTKMLPEADAFPQVEDITISGRSYIQKKTEIPGSWLLPSSLSNLQSLKIEDLSVSFGGMICEGALERLLHLKLTTEEDMPEMEKGALANLKRLECMVKGWSRVRESLWCFLDGLPNLDELWLKGSDITSMEEWGSAYVPKVLHLGKLKVQKLPASMGVKESPFQTLEELTLWKLPELEELPEVHPLALSNLRLIRFSGCLKLKRIPSFYHRYW